MKSRITVLKNYLPEFKFFNTSKNPTLAQLFKHCQNAKTLKKLNENKCLQLTGQLLSTSLQIRRKMGEQFKLIFIQ